MTNTPTNELKDRILVVLVRYGGKELTREQATNQLFSLFTTSQIKMLNDLLTFTDVHGRIHFLISILEGQLNKEEE